MGEKGMENCFDVNDSYGDKILGNCNKEKRAQLHYWYVDKMIQNGKEYVLAHGNVSGHKRLIDTMHIHTSEIQSITINKNTEELMQQGIQNIIVLWNIANGNSKTRMKI